MRNDMMIQAAPVRQPPAVSLVPFLPARRRLDVIGPMLGDLETATNAGQRYVMGKVLVQLREAVAASECNLSDLQSRALRNTLAVLARESDRMLPDAGTFAQGARSIADMLART
jgi:hypothetical protein